MQGFQVPLRTHGPAPENNLFASVQVCKFSFANQEVGPLLGEDPIPNGSVRLFSAFEFWKHFGINLDRKSGAIRAYPAKDSCWQAAGVTDDDTVAQYLELPNHLPGDLMFIACRCQKMT